MKNYLSYSLTLMFFLVLLNTLPLQTKGQVLRYQDFKYHTCDGCDNTMISGSMTVPPDGFNYTTLVNFSENPLHLISDFGPRIAVSRFHLGIDVNPQPQNYDNGDAIFPIETGEIEILRVEEGYKYIITEGTETNRSHHFGYGHLFEYLAPDPAYQRVDLILIRMNAPHENRYAIIKTPKKIYTEKIVLQ